MTTNIKKIMQTRVNIQELLAAVVIVIALLAIAFGSVQRSQQREIGELIAQIEEMKEVITFVGNMSAHADGLAHIHIAPPAPESQRSTPSETVNPEVEL